LAFLITVMAWAVPAAAQARPELPPEVAKLYADPPVIELMTMGVGSLIWERHGHIALCVRYADPHQDACYNYGVGDFPHPVSMGVGFFSGEKTFWVAKERPRDLLSIYIDADRTVWAQPLPLTAAQKQQVIAKLEHDILEPNKYYAYDHFWDNCTTRVRNVLDDATGGALSSIKDTSDDRTFRDLAREGFFGMRIPLLITDIFMGRVTDRVPTYYERMFLPQYLREAVTARWGIQPIVLYERKGPPPLHEGPSGRVWLALVILLLTAPAWITRRWGRFQRTGLAVAIIPPVLLGLILWTLAIASPLPYVRWNESCLVFLPVDVLLLFLAPVRRRAYARGRVAMLGAVALLWLVGVLRQPLAAPLLWPLVPLLVVGFWPARVAATAPAVAAPARASS
jgi:Domain of unknown function (DUF4105)